MAKQFSMSEQKWFCDAWPEAKQVLEMIAAGTGNIFIRLTIAIVIAAGNTMAKRFCPPS